MILTRVQKNSMTTPSYPRNRVSGTLGDLQTKPGLILLLMAVFGLGIYANALDNGFHYDDEHHIVYNPHIRGLKNIPSFFIDPGTFSSMVPETDPGMYRPLLMVSHVLNYAVGGLHPSGYHLVNLIFHVGSSFLVFLILRELLSGRRVRSLSPDFAALAAGLIFLAHPFHSEGVDYISARSSVMSAFFFFLSFWCWVKYRSADLHPHPGTRYYLASLSVFVLALFTKEGVISFLLVLWLYDYFLKSPSAWEGGWKATLPYLPYLLIISGYLGFRRFLFGGTLPDTAFHQFWENLLAQPKVLTGYLRFLVFPSGLTIDHTITAGGWLDPGTILSAAILLAGLALGVWGFSRKQGVWPVVAFFQFWFFIVLLPTTLISLNVAFQENRGYLAGVGFSVGLGLVLAAVHSKMERAAIPILVILLLLYGGMTIRQNMNWENDKTLWSDAVEKNPMSAIAHSNLGRTYLRAGDLDPAEKELRQALDLRKRFPWLVYFHIRHDLAEVYFRKGSFDQAERNMKEVIRLDPGDPYYRIQLAKIYIAMKDWPRAEGTIQDLLKMKPDDPDALTRLGVLYMLQERSGEAIAAFRRALIDPACPRREEIQAFIAQLEGKIR